MSTIDPRAALADAQRALADGALEQARKGFVAAAFRFAGSTQLLGGGHGWRGVAEVATQRGQWQAAERALGTAERLYRMGQELHGHDGRAGDEVDLALREGLATCQLLRADALLRQHLVTDARLALDAAHPLYAGLEERRGFADLWVLTARLAEREGRWYAARTGWESVLRVRRAHHDEPGCADALLRLAEAMLVEGDIEAAFAPLDEVAALARELELPALAARERVARARLHEAQHDFEAAWEVGLDALDALGDGQRELRGLVLVRLARTAARVRPDQCMDQLQRGFLDLVEAEHPDAVALVLHQLAVVALTLGDADTAVVAAAGALAARDGADAALHGVLLRALLQGHHDAAALALARLRAALHPERGLGEEVALLEARLGVAPVEAGSLLAVEALRVDFEELLAELLVPLAHARGLEPAAIADRRAVLCLTEGASGAGTLLPARRVAAPERTERLVLAWSIREGETERFRLVDGVHLIGRGADNAVRMAWDGLASRTHAAIEVEAGGVLLRDMGSQHGVFVDGERVGAPVRLAEGQALTIGSTTFRVERQLSSVRAAVVVPVGS